MITQRHSGLAHQIAAAVGRVLAELHHPHRCVLNTARVQQAALQEGLLVVKLSAKTSARGNKKWQLAFSVLLLTVLSAFFIWKKILPSIAQ